MTAAVLAVAVVQALTILALLYERKDDRAERSELLNRIKPETAQPLPGQSDDPDLLPVDLEHDEAYHQHQQELEEAR